MKPNSPEARIEMMTRSLRCFWFGILGLLPVLGIPAAIYALLQRRRAMRVGGEMWNPARRYLFWGALCARIGLWVFSIIPGVALLIATHLQNQ